MMQCHRARLIPNQAVRGFAPEVDFAIVVTPPPCKRVNRFQTNGSRH